MKCDGLSSQDNFSRNLLECPVCLELAWPPKKIFQVTFCPLFPQLLSKKNCLPICSPPFWSSFLDVLVPKTIVQGVAFVSSLNQFCVLHFLCFCSFVSTLLATFYCFHVNFSRIFFSANFSLFSVSRGPHHLRGVQGQPCLEGLPIHYLIALN